MYVLVTIRSLKKLVGGFLLKGELGRTIGSAALGGEIPFKTETASMPPVPTYSKIFMTNFKNLLQLNCHHTKFYCYYTLRL